MPCGGGIEEPWSDGTAERAHAFLRLMTVGARGDSSPWSRRLGLWPLDSAVRICWSARGPESMGKECNPSGRSGLAQGLTMVDLRRNKAVECLNGRADTSKHLQGRPPWGE